ncbi:MAG: TonB-dependent receptor [Pseudomonadota bacterium]
MSERRVRNIGAVSLALSSLLPPFLSTGAAAQEDPQAPAQSCENGSCTVSYGSDFFARYAPVTALDMVRNLPGFALDDGDGSRGFAGSAGNILLDGERVSSKSEQPSDVLSRIPASQVERIEVIRGQTGGTDLRGQTVIANVIRKEGGFSGAFEAGANTFDPAGGFYPFGSGSVAFQRGGASFTLGVEASRYLGFIENDERVFGPADQLIEVRDEIFREDGHRGNATLQAVVPLGETMLRFNANYSLFDEAGGETSIRTPVGGQPFVLFQGDTDEETAFEIGADLERAFGEAWSAKLIGLYRSADFTETGSLILRDDDLTDSETFFNSVDTEAIIRTEIDFSGIQGHLIELAVEGSVNNLESRFAFLRNEGGVLVPQDVPGAETEVEEERVDVTLSDSFAVGPIAVDLVLAGETSTITQTGGFAEERSFSFFRPGLTLTYTPSKELQLRLQGQREIGQLDFFDFVSAADLGDVELSLGNPDLAPETTIAFELSVERRFGELGVVTVTGFHDEITDVQDLLPLEGVLEVPGNIGDGTRSGVRTEATFPLEKLGIAGARLDLTGEWQTSSVTDPLTDEDRRLSGERRWEGNIAFRQDLTSRKFAWGTDVSLFDDAPQFGLDERDNFRSGIDWDVFAETRAVQGMRIRLGVENILGEGTLRAREVFQGPRSDNIRAFTERRDGATPRQIFLQANGTF